MNDPGPATYGYRVSGVDADGESIPAAGRPWLWHTMFDGTALCRCARSRAFRARHKARR